MARVQRAHAVVLSARKSGPRRPPMSFDYPPQQSFSNSPPAQPPRRSGPNWLLAFILIGLGFITLGGVVVIGGAWYLATNIQSWVVSLGREAIVAAINDSELPKEEKA